MDGSTDNTGDIIQSFDNVKYFIKDQDLYPPRRIYDGARQFLLEKIQSDFGTDGWITLLHGDEIFVDDPNSIAQKANDCGAEKVNWHCLNFFIHSSQSKSELENQNSIQDSILFYQPGSLEIRQFKNKENLFYNLNSNDTVFPHGLNNKLFLDFPILKHYVKRTLSQIENKPLSGFPDARKIENKEQGVFTDKLQSNLKQVRKYDGTFHEFSPGKRRSFFIQWLLWNRYIQFNWGSIGILFNKLFKMKKIFSIFSKE